MHQKASTKKREKKNLQKHNKEGHTNKKNIQKSENEDK